MNSTSLDLYYSYGGDLTARQMVGCQRFDRWGGDEQLMSRSMRVITLNKY
jgi:hypothetical protein